MTFQIIAGPCVVESEEMIHDIANVVWLAGGTMLRGGVYKPLTRPERTATYREAPYRAAQWLYAAAGTVDLPTVAEMGGREGPSPDRLQIGARNMQNFELLSTVTQPTLLKRHFGCTLDEVWGAVQYLQEGYNDVWVCERGVVGMPDMRGRRYRLDFTFVLDWKAAHPDIPIIVDVSHGTREHDYVIPAARAAKAIGADGIMVDVHPDPPNAWVDPDQALTFAEFRTLVTQCT